jgi:hypothetical protein
MQGNATLLYSILPFVKQTVTQVGLMWYTTYRTSISQPLYCPMQEIFLDYLKMLYQVLEIIQCVTVDGIKNREKVRI